MFGTYFSSCWPVLEEGFCISAARVSFKNFSVSGGSSFCAESAWRLERAILGGGEVREAERSGEERGRGGEERRSGEGRGRSGEAG